jgi:hypothetical protein
MTSDTPERRRRRPGAGPKPSLPGRRPLTIHLPGEMLESLREAARQAGVGVGEMARRIIGKGLYPANGANAANGEETER